MSERRKENERGAALIAALCVLLTVGMLAASAVAISKIAAEGLSVGAGRAEAWYAAESCASRVQWLLMKDRERNADRELGRRDDKKAVDEERFLADGATHRFELYGAEAECAISDMLSGIDPSAASLKSIFAQDMALGGSEASEPVMTFLNRLDDYCDGDDFIRLNGMERQDYAAAGLAGLPRNGTMKFREELMLIPGFERLFPNPESGVLDYFRPIAPPGMPAPQGKPSFFSADEFLIKRLCKFQGKEAEQAVSARDAWRKDGSLLSDSLDPAVLERLKASLSFKESPWYTLTVKGRAEGGMAPGTIRMSLKIDKQPQSGGALYYEWMQY